MKIYSLRADSFRSTAELYFKGTYHMVISPITVNYIEIFLYTTTRYLIDIHNGIARSKVWV